MSHANASRTRSHSDYIDTYVFYSETADWLRRTQGLTMTPYYPSEMTFQAFLSATSELRPWHPRNHATPIVSLLEGPTACAFTEKGRPRNLAYHVPSTPTQKLRQVEAKLPNKR